MDVKEIMRRNDQRLKALYSGKDPTERYERLADAFRAHFGREPELFVSAPGRTEVIGNHTDHNRAACWRRRSIWTPSRPSRRETIRS